MTKRLNSKHKVDRRLKVNLWGRPKSPFNTRAYPPGQHGQARSSKPSDNGIQLIAKGLFRDVSNCHCRQCMKTHGNYAAYTNIPEQDI